MESEEPMLLRHYLALLGILLIAVSPAAILLAERWVALAVVFISGGILCLSVAVMLYPNET